MMAVFYVSPALLDVANVMLFFVYAKFMPKNSPLFSVSVCRRVQRDFIPPPKILLSCAVGNIPSLIQPSPIARSKVKTVIFT